MKRRVACLACALVLLLLCTAAKPAKATIAPDMEFVETIAQLESYLASPGQSAFPLENIVTEFWEGKGYSEYGLGFYLYAQVLYDVERGEWSTVQTNCELLKSDKLLSFQQYLLSDEFKAKYKSIQTVNDLVSYACGRYNESSGLLQDAANWYYECLLYYDAFARYSWCNTQLSHSQTPVPQVDPQEQTYQAALEQFANRQYEAAATLFYSLGDYKDSQQYYEQAMALYQNESAYQQAIQMLGENRLWEAMETFKALGGYENSAQYYAQAVQMIIAEQKTQAENAPEQWLVGHWTVAEAEPGRTISRVFDVDIYSVDPSGAVQLQWGGSAARQGTWNAGNRTLSVSFPNSDGSQSTHVYVLANRVLGGGRQAFSALAVKEGTLFEPVEESIYGNWTMTEFNRNSGTTINFGVVIQPNDNGGISVEWSGRKLSGSRWESWPLESDAAQGIAVLTVYADSKNRDKAWVYVFCNGMLAGGNNQFCGIAVRETE